MKRKGLDIEDQQLMTLLQEMVQDKGYRGTARVLEIDRRTVAACINRGGLSWRAREALVRVIKYESDAPAAEQRERIDNLEDRVDELEEKVRNSLKDMRTALDEFKDETAGELRGIDRRPTGLSLHGGGSDPRPTGDDDDGGRALSNGPSWKYQREPTEPLPDTMTNLVFKWRQALVELMVAEDRLSNAVGWDVALVDHSASMGEAPAKRRTPKRRQLSKRKLARTANAGDNLLEAG